MLEVNLSLMRWRASSGGLVVGALLVAAALQGWVISQGTSQLIQPGWRAFRYATPLLVALVMALAGLIPVRIRPPANRTTALTIGVMAGLVLLLFCVVLFSFFVMPFPHLFPTP